MHPMEILRKVVSLHVVCFGLERGRVGVLIPKEKWKPLLLMGWLKSMWIVAYSRVLVIVELEL